MSAGSRLREFVDKTQHAPHAHTAGADWFKRLNLDAIARDLKIDELGQERGEREEPLSDTVDFDEVEDRILDYVRDRKADAEQELKEQRDDYLRRLSRNSLLTLVNEIDEAARIASTKIDHEVEQAQGSLPMLAAKAKAARADCEAFKSQHQITRTARYPSSARRFLQWSLIAVLVLAESAANGTFFARGNDMGLVGGWSEAVMFAAINIVFAIIVGQTAGRFIGHRDRRWRALSAFALLIWLAGTVLFAVFVGHYRDALEAQAADAFAVAVVSFRVSALGFESIHSWILLFAGIFAGLAALVDARFLDDPYPGFGGAARSADEAEEEYEDERKQHLEEIQAAYEEAVSTMSRKARDFGKRMADSERILVDLKTLASSYRLHLTYLEGVGNNLLQLYRDANRRARSTKAPSSFRKKWKEFAVPDGHIEPAEYSRENLERVIANAEKRRDLGNAKLEKKRTQAAASLKPLHEV